MITTRTVEICFLFESDERASICSEAAVYQVDGMVPDLFCILLGRCLAEVHQLLESKRAQIVAYMDDIEVSIVRLTQELSLSFGLSLSP